MSPNFASPNFASSKVATITLNPAIDHTAAIPNFRAGAVNRVEWEQVDPGGKGVNVASFLAQFGVAVAASGFLGIDNQTLFQRFFEQKGIQNHFIPIAGKTRINVKIIDVDCQQITDINFPGQSPEAADIDTLHQTIARLSQDYDWFILSGSLPVGVTPDIYGKLIATLKANDKTVVLDASGESLRQAIATAPYAIKPNLEELQELVGHPLLDEAAIVDAIQTLLAKGIHTVIVSMGAQGAIFAEADERVHVQSPPIEVVSTVGAGDAMVSGFVTGQLRGLSLPDCARLATAFSIGALSQVGPRLPPPATVESFMHQVAVRSL
jgi:1-phosphofructokinase family hexose kinase